jgi:hypothetical protein
MIMNGLVAMGLSMIAKEIPERIQPPMMVRFRPILSPSQPWKT